MTLLENTSLQKPLTPWFKLLSIAPQLRGFVFAGLVGTLIDYGFYHLYGQWLPPLFSKGFAFSSATLFVYFMNKFWTFKQPLYSRRELSAFFALYTVSMLVNTGVNSFSLHFISSIINQWEVVGNHTTEGAAASFLLLIFTHPSSIKLTAFLMATATSTVINFIGQKFWVFELKRKQVIKKLNHPEKQVSN